MLDDDDWDDEITLVGQMSEEIKALRQGYRQRSLFDEPAAPVDDKETMMADDDRPALWVGHLTMDVTDPDSVEAAFAEACRTFGGVDIVVPNAGIAHIGSLVETDPSGEPVAALSENE